MQKKWIIKSRSFGNYDITMYDTYKEFLIDIQDICVQEGDSGPDEVWCAVHEFNEEPVIDTTTEYEQTQDRSRTYARHIITFKDEEYINWYKCNIQRYEPHLDENGERVRDLVNDCGDCFGDEPEPLAEWIDDAYRYILPDEIEEEGRLEMAGGRK